MAKKKKGISPEELATKADQLKALQVKRLELAKEVDLMEGQEKALKQELIQMFQDSNVQGIAGRLAYVSLVEKTVPVAQDWDKLYEYIQETGDFDLLHRRLTTSAVAARWEGGVEVPGVASESYFDLSIRKPK